MSIKNYLKIKNCLIVLAILVFMFSAIRIHAQENRVDYNGQPAVDSDLDGLTDNVETQIYYTDSRNPDTDNDGIMDGTEVIKSTDPLDSSNPIIYLESIKRETAWIWYFARAAGIIGFIFLWLTIFLGLSISNPILKKIVEPIYSFDFHCFMAAMAVFWALVHGTSLLFDKFLGFGIKDVAIPYFSQTTYTNSNYVALGIMAFYMIVIMTITSYLRDHLKHWLWRIFHFLNPVAFVFVVVHGYFNGTDIKNFYIGSAYLFSSFLLVLIYLSSLIFALWNKFRAPSAEEILNR